MAQLICKNLSVGYDNKKIIENLSFEVNKGDYLCVVGENGSGKTTLMKTILGLMKQIDGEILFDEGILKYNIGYLPQQTKVQKDFPASVREIVLSGCLGGKKFKPFYSKEDKILAEENMRHLGIFPLQKKSYRELSGGQQQRVLLARALCATRQMLFLDEPVAGLDLSSTNEMYNLLKKLNRGGITIVMISHDINAVKNFATHILHIGKNLFFGKIGDYLKTKQYKSLSFEKGETK